MKKVGIITLNGYFNYGNRLQNYALQEVLKSLGFQVETILIDTTNHSENTSSIPMRKRMFFKNRKKKEIAFSEVFYKIITILWNQIHKKEIVKSRMQRIKRLKVFSNKYIKETKFSISSQNIPEDLASRYDYFVTGSDQVWNPDYIQNSSIYFLTFAPGKKRIAYSPSFGISHIPPKYLEDYKLWLSEMASISVREEAGADIIRNLTGREAEVLIDPTLLLTKENWLLICKESAHIPKRPYLLTYFLGEQTLDRKNKIKEIARKNRLIVVNLADMTDSKRYSADPGEFIGYIQSSSVLFTDSFHGCVFAILFEKPFVVFDRIGTTVSMNSRIDTLLGTFRLQTRKWEILKKEEMFQLDYSQTAPILEDERNKAMDYLKGALS
jgi:hypothetical protein